MSALLLKNGTLVTEKGTIVQDIFIENGIVQSLHEPGQNLPEFRGEEIDARGLLIFPGLIDCHVHFREPGNTDAEDMKSGAEAAKSGGVTTVCDMPNTNPPTCTRAALQEKRTRAERIQGCDIRFFFGATKTEHLEELRKVERESICGMKLYLGHSTGNLKVESGVEEQVFKLCAERNIPVVCHCEDEEVIERNSKRLTGGELSLHSEIRSVEAAVVATMRAIAFAEKYGTHLHIAHLSTKEELELVRRAKDEGLSLTCEVAPHHLFLTTDNYATLGTLAKMNPPLRTPDHPEALWKGIADGTVDCIASDHAPHTLISKKHPPLEAPSGVPGVETMLPLLLSCISSKGPLDQRGDSRLQATSYKLQAHDILRLLFTRPNEIFSLGKPGIAPGKAVDLILVNPLAKWVISGKNLHSKCGWTPYEGWEVTGRVERVIGIG